MTGKNAIVCNQVSKSYRANRFGKAKYVHALRGISLHAAYGSIVGLIGPNGAGKTTLMNLIAGVLHLDHGEILIGGHPVGAQEAKLSLGYVPESPAFLEEYTVEAVLNYHGALCHLQRSPRGQRTGELLDQFGLREMRKRRCGKLSQGNRQRLALAIACVMQPKVLILDEPSNGLDPVGVVHLRQIVGQLSSQGTAVLISSHRLTELEKLTTDFIGIWDGRIVDVGKSLLKRNGQLLKIELERSPGEELRTVLSHEIVRERGAELAVRIGSPEEISSIVAGLTAKGLAVKHVEYGSDDESIEDVFLRISQEKGTGRD